MKKAYTPPQVFETTPRPPIQLARVKSSQVAAIGHDPATNTLAMQFKPRTDSAESVVYHYPNVNAEDAAELIGADSIGTHFGLFFKPLPFLKFPAEPLPPEA